MRLLHIFLKQLRLDAYSIPKVGGNVKHFFVVSLCVSVPSVKRKYGSLDGGGSVTSQICYT